jgi:hypothetical protein
MNFSRQTIFSPCRKYRYMLWRSWGDDLFANRTKDGFVMFIGLNPSTADETKDDQTIRKCIGFAKRWGYLQMCMTNLFAWRDTDPMAMKRAGHHVVGMDNHHHLLQCASVAALVVAAWGKNGKHMNQDLTVRQYLSGIGVTLHHLGLNDDGTPKHPLYLLATTEPKTF